MNVHSIPCQCYFFSDVSNCTGRDDGYYQDHIECHFAIQCFRGAEHTRTPCGTDEVMYEGACTKATTVPCSNDYVTATTGELFIGLL